MCRRLTYAFRGGVIESPLGRRFDESLFVFKRSLLRYKDGVLARGRWYSGGALALTYGR